MYRLAQWSFNMLIESSGNLCQHSENSRNGKNRSKVVRTETLDLILKTVTLVTLFKTEILTRNVSEFCV